VLGIDKANQRISLGMKQLDTDPWSIIDTRFKVGDVVKGRVAKIASFGAFVELEDDIDGLVHISQISEDRRQGQGRAQRRRRSGSTRHQGGQGGAPHRPLHQGHELQRSRHPEGKPGLRSLRPSTDLVGLEQAFKFATEEWRPGGQ
jgi:small subunit ribosomal protein S1